MRMCIYPYRSFVHDPFIGRKKPKQLSFVYDLVLDQAATQQELFAQCRYIRTDADVDVWIHMYRCIYAKAREAVYLHVCTYIQ